MTRTHQLHVQGTPWTCTSRSHSRSQLSGWFLAGSRQRRWARKHRGRSGILAALLRRRGFSPGQSSRVDMLWLLLLLLLLLLLMMMMMMMMLLLLLLLRLPLQRMLMRWKRKQQRHGGGNEAHDTLHVSVNALAMIQNIILKDVHFHRAAPTGNRCQCSAAVHKTTNNFLTMRPEAIRRTLSIVPCWRTPGTWQSSPRRPSAASSRTVPARAGACRAAPART
jgi:hypothetical protein